MTVIPLRPYGILLFAAILMVIRRSPIHAVSLFILISSCASAIFTPPHVDFIGSLFPMVYVGAIAVLSIFVVMMLNIKRIERDNTTHMLLGGFILSPFTLQLVYLLMSPYATSSPHNVIISDTLLFDHQTNNDEFVTKYVVQPLGIVLSTKYNMELILTGVTLLVAPIGSIFSTNMTTGYARRRQHNQLTRNNKLFNPHIY
jgi:NADH:ubiquinone oxidoreductase subunit 6 (subunit J)